MSAAVHLCDYGSQPDIRIACDQSWGTPAWGKPPAGLPDGVHLRDDGRLYAFERALVTCPACTSAGASRGPHIATITGGIWYPFAPRAEDVRLADARALAYQPRYLGHAGAAYSPIQHMVLVATWLMGQGADGAIVLEGLGHDIHEAWPPGDVPAPCKRGDEPEAVMLRAWEARVAAVVRPVLGLPLETSPAVERADRVLFATEIRDLNPEWPGEIDWGPLPEPWSERIEPWPAERAWAAWLEMWRDLGGALEGAPAKEIHR